MVSIFERKARVVASAPAALETIFLWAHPAEMTARPSAASGERSAAQCRIMNFMRGSIETRAVPCDPQTAGKYRSAPGRYRRLRLIRKRRTAKTSTLR